MNTNQLMILPLQEVHQLREKDKNPKHIHLIEKALTKRGETLLPMNYPVNPDYCYVNSDTGEARRSHLKATAAELAVQWGCKAIYRCNLSERSKI